MMIPYTELPSHKIGWGDGFHWLEELARWSLDYEKEHMVPAATNNHLAESHLDVLFVRMPNGLRRIGRQIIFVMLGDRLRKSMM